MGHWEQTNLLHHELTQGIELARQLHVQLNESSSSHETPELLLEKILATFEKTLAMVNCIGSTISEPSQSIEAVVPMVESPSLSLSPWNEEFPEGDFKDLSTQNVVGKKSKKHFLTWIKQIQVSPDVGFEGSLDDGYSWRKYGQKHILGAKYPRGYYRCNRKNDQGCPATKKVQRSDKDPTIFEITYRGKHTCTQTSDTNNPRNYQEDIIMQENQELTSADIFHQRQQQDVMLYQQSSQEVLINFQEGLGIQTGNLDNHYQSSSFCFATSSSNSQLQNPVVSHSLKENSFIQNISPLNMSPVTSGVSDFSVSPNSFGGNYSFPSSDELEIEDMIPAATTSAANSPTIGLDYPFEEDEFEQNFTFSNPGFFS